MEALYDCTSRTPKGTGLKAANCTESQYEDGDLLEQLQQFGKSTWHPSNFGKTRKFALQQFGKPTWQK
jgi:hypothetical protein